MSRLGYLLIGGLILNEPSFSLDAEADRGIIMKMHPKLKNGSL